MNDLHKLRLSKRIVRILEYPFSYAGKKPLKPITTIERLRSISDQEFLRISGIGSRSVIQIRYEIESHDWRLKNYKRGRR